MGMTLTKEDLLAINETVTKTVNRTIGTTIKTIVGKMISDASDRLEARLMARIDDLDDTLSIQTERGLQEVRDRIGAVKEVVDRIDRVQQAELERNDRQDAAIHQIRKSLHAA